MIAQACEQWRQHLRGKWLNQREHVAWTPRCAVVVHARRESYQAAVGPGGRTSFGSTWIDVKQAKVSARRIDLLIDGHGRLSALPHELTHVVIADAFPGKQPPPWANEGMAMLADTQAKQSAHLRDAQSAHRSGAGFTCLELMALESYPHPHRIPAFYGQSASLVTLLTGRGESHQFVEFLQRSVERGYDRALQDVYGINGMAELQRLSTGHVVKGVATAETQSTASSKVAALRVMHLPSARDKHEPDHSHENSNSSWVGGQ